MSPFREGLWRQNPAFVQLLGLCPLLAVSTTVAHGLALALATAWVMVSSATVISCLRGWIPRDVRLPIFVLCVATMTSAAIMVMEAWAQPLYLALALFLQIIITNCAILGRLESFAAHQPPVTAILDALGRALGFGLVLVALGILREVLAEGTIACGLEDLLGPAAQGACLTVHEGPRVILAASPAGAFFLLALMIALRNQLQAPAEDEPQPLRDPAPLTDPEQP